MTPRRMFLIVLATAMALPAIAARAAEDVLRAIPDDALAFGIVYRLAETDEKIQQLGKKVQAPIPSLLGLGKMAAGVEKGIDEKGCAAVIVMPGEDKDSEPVAIILVSVTDYEQFIAQLGAEKTSEKITEVKIQGQATLVARRGSCAAFAESRNRKGLEKFLDAKTDVSGQLSEVAPWLPENDAVWVFPPASVKFFARKGQEALRTTKEALGQAGPEMAPALAVFDVYSQILAVAEKEVTTLAVGVQADRESNLRLTARTRFTRIGVTALALSQIKPSERNLMAGLPGGPFVFAMGSEVPGALLKGMVGFSMNMMKQNPDMYGLNAEQIDKMTALSLQSLASLQSFSMLMKPAKGGEPIYSNVLGALQVQDAEQYLADYEKQIAAMNEILKDAKSSLMKPSTITKTEIGGKPALQLEMTIPQPKAAAGMPNIDQFMDKLFGPGRKATIYLVAADKHSVVMGYNSTKELVAKAIAAAGEPKSGLAGDAEVAKTSAMLTPGSQMVSYFSPRGMVAMGRRLIAMAMPEPGMMPRIPEFPETPPVGFAVKVAPQEVRAEVLAPAAVLEGIGAFVKQIQQGVKIDAP